MRKNYYYGVSSKFNFGKWEHNVYKFLDLGKAEEWLEREEYDFRVREIMTKTALICSAKKQNTL